MPSKLLSALVAGVPVLAYCDKDTPLAQEIEDGGYGWVVTPDQKGYLAHVLNEVTETQLREKSEAAFARSKIFNRERILKIYADELNNLSLRANTKPRKIEQDLGKLL